MYLVAECGVNHGGDLVLAERMIGEAQDAGADAVKFQLFSAEKLKRPEIEALELSYADILALAEKAKEIGVDFLCTPFDVEALEFLADNHLVKRMKLSSGALFNAHLLAAAGQCGLPIILSTGMANLTEIGNALGELRSAPTTLLHCVSEYPCPLEHANLRAMRTLHEEFGLEVGYSDHTADASVVFAAGVLGARLIEAHFTLDRNADGPDHASSMEPAMFAATVDRLREIPAMLGDGHKIIRKHEAEVRKVWT